MPGHEASRGGGVLLGRRRWFWRWGAAGLGAGVAHAVADPVLVRIKLRKPAIDRGGNVTAGEWRIAVCNGVDRAPVLSVVDLIGAIPTGCEGGGIGAGLGARCRWWLATGQYQQQRREQGREAAH